MNEQPQHPPRHKWLGWIALLAFASVLSPVNIHIVIAQDAPEIVIAPADPGEPPTPPKTLGPPAPATPTIAPEATTENASTLVVAPTPAETAAQIPDVPVAPSEVSSETEIGKLIPNDEPLTASIVSALPKADPESVRTLSVEPGVRPMLPADRPAWVGASPDYTSPQHRLHVGSLPTTDARDADEALDEPLIAAVRNYIDQEVVNQLGASSKMPIDAAFIRRNLIDDPSGYVCELTTSQGSMFQKWVTVRVTPEQRELFTKWHTEAAQRTRLAPIGLGLVSVLALVSLTHMVLRRHGASPFPLVNQHATEPAVAVRRSRSWTALKVLGFLVLVMIPAFFVLAALLFTVRSRQVGPVVETHISGTSLPYEVQFPDLHKELRIETLGGGERTIVIESKSRR